MMGVQIVVDDDEVTGRIVRLGRAGGSRGSTIAE